MQAVAAEFPGCAEKFFLTRNEVVDS